MENIRVKYVASVVVGVLALFIPLVRDFHIESAILAATTGAFWGGWTAVKKRVGRSDAHHALEICGLLYLAGLPLLLFALITGCFTVHGLGFWVFLPAPSVLLGVGMGRLTRFLKLPAPRFITAFVLILIAIGGLLFEFLTFPQLYFFNHVWGYWPGPIYDEAVQFPASLLGFRFITLCWILTLWLIPILHEDKIYTWIVGLSVVGLIISYTQMEHMGLVSPREYLQHQLGGEKQTDHAKLFYAKDAYSDEEIDRLSTETEFFIHQIQTTLNIDKPESAVKIELYLYADPWQKKELVGAKYTSYVTVWQPIPQIHIAKEQIDGSMKHEVVHAVTALLDWPGLLPNIGLTEGIAVALDPDRSSRSTIDQLVASEKPYPSAQEMQSALSYWGFYTGRSAVNYTTAGSFVRYLVETHPPEHFVQAYQSGSLERGYTESFSQLIDGWHQRLDSVRVDSSDRRRADQIFGQSSIFEQHCPHKIPLSAQLFDRYRLSVARQDTGAAISSLTKLKQLDSTQTSPKLLWAIWNLRTGNTRPVIKETILQDDRIESQLLAADAFRMERAFKKAQKFLHKAAELAEQQNDSTFDETITIRRDSLQWSYDLRLRYERAVLDPEAFSNARYRLKIQAVENTLQKDAASKELLSIYAKQLLELSIELDFFNTYLSMIHRLIYYHEFDLAQQWITKLHAQEISLRYHERLQQEEAWFRFISTAGE
ncbi:MAG: hypothetical protein U5K69_11615 [Balneolaceae bacterium]|nr:hypothetical protein [Balneolaceae bacterium]